MPYDKQARNWSLTYPCPVDEEDHPLNLDIINEFLLQLEDVAGFIISEELHANGKRHYHCLLSFNRTVRHRNAHWADIQNIHGQYEGTRSINRWKKYILKDNIYRSNGIYTDGSPKSPKRKKNKWVRLHDATNQEEVLEIFQTTSPRTYYINRDRIASNAIAHFKPPPLEYITPANAIFNIVPELQYWVDTYMIEGTIRPLTLILWGPSRIGKTVWARSLGQHMYYQNLFNLDDWDMTAKYIIFDDVDFDYIPARKSFVFAQQQFTITDKYKKKKTISFGKPCIYINNSEPEWSKYEPAYKDNTFIVYVDTPMVTFE